VTENLDKLRTMLSSLNDRDTTCSDFFDSGLDLFAIITRKSFVRVNKVWESLLGWNVDDLMSKPWTDLVDPKDNESAMQMMERLESEPVYNHKNRILSKKSECKWISWTFTKWDGDGISYCSGKDISAFWSDDGYAKRK